MGFMDANSKGEKVMPVIKVYLLTPEMPFVYFEGSGLNVTAIPLQIADPRNPIANAIIGALPIIVLPVAWTESGERVEKISITGSAVWHEVSPPLFWATRQQLNGAGRKIIA